MSKQGRWLSEAVGKLLAARRNELGLTQAGVAESLRIQRTSLSNIESGKQVLLLDVFYDLCKELDISPIDTLELAITKVNDISPHIQVIDSIVNQRVDK